MCCKVQNCASPAHFPSPPPHYCRIPHQRLLTFPINSCLDLSHHPFTYPPFLLGSSSLLLFHTLSLPSLLKPFLALPLLCSYYFPVPPPCSCSFPFFFFSMPHSHPALFVPLPLHTHAPFVPVSLVMLPILYLCIVHILALFLPLPYSYTRPVPTPALLVPLPCSYPCLIYTLASSIILLRLFSCLVCHPSPVLTPAPFLFLPYFFPLIAVATTVAATAAAAVAGSTAAGAAVAGGGKRQVGK